MTFTDHPKIPLPPAGFDSEPSPSDSAERSDEDSISPTRSRGGELGGARIDVGGDEDEDAGWGVVAPRGRGNSMFTTIILDAHLTFLKKR